MVTVDPDASYCVSVQAQYDNQNTIDVYWLFDDGGEFIVVNRIMSMHKSQNVQHNQTDNVGS